MAFSAFLDACVLAPYNLADLLLTMPDSGSSYRPLWSPGVLEELERTLVDDLGVQPASAQYRIETMVEYFDDAMVTGYEDLINGMTNHPKDRHVLAAAVKGGAQVIVTNDVKGFPASALKAYDITAVSADQFLRNQLDMYPQATVAALLQVAEDRDNPPTSVAEVLGYLNVLVPGFVAEVIPMLPEQS
ncbi:PIN domain-containing protein [Amycolatopsis sp. NPDC023774]|uniref:PIN domain-containing protein n=1 Tax=Amycolatopsis sp. NPDC023774 TaxID=3155015 RepID=UPI0033F8ECDD